jgi:HEAT repeat protein
MKKADLDQVEVDVRSPHQPTRYAALHRMTTWIRLNPACHPEALRIFRQVLSNPLDGGTANAALYGLDELGCKSEAQGFRLQLLVSSKPDVVRTALLGFRNPKHAPMLLDLLARQTDTDVRISVVRTLGRMQPASKLVLPALVRLLPDSDLRPHITEALGDLADPDAIPHLENLLEDSSEAWEIDNHGPMLRVSDLAAESIRRIKSARSF